MSAAAGAGGASGFAGFEPDAMRFFAELADHQDRDWMAANKARYESSVRAPLEALVIALSGRCDAADIPLRGDPKHALFRLNRDTRFSADKRPYKENASAALTRDGDKRSPGVFYLQIALSASFAAAGFFRPEPGVLHALREGLAADPERWAQMRTGLAAAGFALGRDDTLIRPPKGFEKAPANVLDDLKLRSWTITRPLSPAELGAAELVEHLLALARHALPLLEFGWSALAR